MGCFWVGLFAALAFLSPPQPLGTLIAVGLAGSILGFCAGLALPKVFTCLLYPFALFGVTG